jgi:hypothetical protein
MNWLREELAQVSMEEIECGGVESLQPSDKIIGVLEDIYIRKLSVIYRRLLDEIHEVGNEATQVLNCLEENQEDLPAEHDTATCPGCIFRRRGDRLIQKKDLVEKLFWTCVYEELPPEVFIEKDRMESNGIGIREGWQIVLVKEPSPMDLLIEALAQGMKN